LLQIYDLQNIEATNSGTFWYLSLADAIKARNEQVAEEKLLISLLYLNSDKHTVVV